MFLKMARKYVAVDAAVGAAVGTCVVGAWIIFAYNTVVVFLYNGSNDSSKHL